jgi:Type I phosphodiesterase / nucleotide pyrophosphatase
MQKLPDWATKFNKGPRIARAVKEAGLDETTQFYSLVGHTPAANSYELDFVRALIEGESMGQNSATDVLTVSLSANDIQGHQFGPDSDAEREMVIRLDQDLDSFFSYIDKKIGLKNVMVALTADHGVAPIPTESAKLGVASARLDLDALTEAIDESLNARFSPNKGVQYFMPTQELPYLALDPRAFGAVSENDAEQAVINAIPAAVKKLGAPVSPPNTLLTSEATRRYQESRVDADPSIYFSRTRVDLEAGTVPNTDFGRLISHSYTDHGGWYVMIFTTAYQMEYSTGIQTTHFSPWSYDRHVPLGFFGEEFLPGLYREQVAPVDIAATFASVLGVNAPSASVGRVLTEALRPVNANGR